MFRLFLFWLPSLLRSSAYSAVFAAPVVGFLALRSAPLEWLVGVGLTCFALPFYPYGLQLERFGRATWRFRTAEVGPIVFRYAPELMGRIDLDQCAKRGSEALAHFSKKFGVTLRRSLVIFLFPTSTSISRIFNSPYSGFALIRGDAIGVSVDQNSGRTIDEIVLHEISHLFAARIGVLDPPFKSEGLATWLMGTLDGKPIDFHALATLLTGPCEFLIRLTTPDGFFHVPNSYIFAGSFTGDLINRFGWNRYHDFFHRSNSKNFEASFAQVFGLSLMKAEQQWRDDLMQRRQTFEPALTRYMAECSVESAYHAGHVYRCLHEIDALSRSGQVTGVLKVYAATAHMYLGHYNEAICALEQALLTDDLGVRGWSGHSRLLLGNLYDLLGDRTNAKHAYQLVLGEPDFWTGPNHSTHARAKHYLKRAFTEWDIWNALRQTSKESGGKQKRRR